jgi:uncharacterized protein YndB with AHSA1/START domain
MINRKHSVTIEIKKTPENVFDHLIQFTKWWPEEYVGGEIKQNTEFVFKSEGGHYSKNKVIEFAPNKKLVWITTESKREADDFDWTGTKMIFELSPEGNNTLLHFTYDGVVLETEQDRLAQICDFCIKDRFYNFIESFTTTIEVAKSPQYVFKCLTTDVALWWGGKDFSGKSAHLGDEFIINHPGAHYSKQKLIEVLPNKKIVWHVTESALSWLKNKEDWKDTRMIFEIKGNDANTILKFTHEGLSPGKESYATCSEGWSKVITEWLYKFIMEGAPRFNLQNQ